MNGIDEDSEREVLDVNSGPDVAAAEGNVVEIDVDLTSLEYFLLWRFAEVEAPAPVMSEKVKPKHFRTTHISRSLLLDVEYILEATR